MNEQVAPVVTRAQEIAADLLEAVDVLEASIPGLERAHPLKRRRVLAQRTVPRDFIASMAAAVEQSEELQRLGSFDVEEARATLQFAEALGPVADRIAALLANVIFTVEWHRATVADAALRTYAIAKGLARDAGGAEVGALLPILRRDLGHGRPRGRRGPDDANDQQPAATVIGSASGGSQ